MHQNLIGPFHFNRPITLGFDYTQRKLWAANRSLNHNAIKMKLYQSATSMRQQAASEDWFLQCGETTTLEVHFSWLIIEPLIAGNMCQINIVTESENPSMLITEIPTIGLPDPEPYPKQRKKRKKKEKPAIFMSGDHEQDDPISAILRPAAVAPVITFVVPFAPAEAPEGRWNAWFSPKGAALAGLGYGFDESGAIVEYTEISRKREPASKWQDLKYVGLVRVDSTKKKEPGLLDIIFPDPEAE